MNRATRKANLKKLQLDTNASAEHTNTRKQRSNHKTTATTTISNFFATTNEAANNNDAELSNECARAEVSQTRNNVQKAEKATTTKEKNLTNFVYKTTQDIPNHIKANPNQTVLDDFATPAKRAKKAPQLQKVKPAATAKPSKTRAAKKQASIKSAFLRNEQLFNEITAQHCIADNFSPDDVQLAIALSQSEAETSGVLLVDDDDVQVVDLISDERNVAEQSIRSKLQKYGFRTAAKDDYNYFAAGFCQGGANNKRRKNKWANKFTALTLRNAEMQSKKLQEKLQTFLQQQCISKPLSAQAQQMQAYSFVSNTLREYAASTNSVLKYLQDVPLNNLQEFYVADLFEVASVPAGHLLKSWRTIQGRDLSPKNTNARRAQIEQNLNAAYKDLEAHFETQRLETLTQVEVAAKAKLAAADDEMELNHLLELIEQLPNDVTAAEQQDAQSLVEHKNMCNENVKSPLKEPPDKKLKLENECTTGEAATLSAGLEQTTSQKGTSFSLVLSATENHENTAIITTPSSSTSATSALKNSTSSFSIQSYRNLTQASSLEATSTHLTISTTQQTRATSPDLFADSDAEEHTDEAEDEVKDAEVSALKSTKQTSKEDMNDITIYEVYSSDEVKTSIATESLREIQEKEIITSTDITIDLTQEDWRQQIDTSRTLHENALQKSDSTDDLNAREDCSEQLQFTLNESAFESTTKSAEANEQKASCSERTMEDIKRILQSHKEDAIFDALLKKYLLKNDTENKRKSLSSTQLSCAPETAPKNKTKDNLSSFLETFKSPTKPVLKATLHRRTKSASFSLNNSASRNLYFEQNVEESIDLTQEAVEDYADDDECIMLSDDEINYSIWKADKTQLRTKTEAESCSDDDEANLAKTQQSICSWQQDMQPSTSASVLSKDFDYELEHALAADNNAHEFSYHDLINEPASFDKSNAAELANFDFDNDFEPINSQFLATPKKCIAAPHTQHSSASDLIMHERAAFGILESPSEPFTQSPFQTPAKTAINSSAIAALDFSIEPLTPVKAMRSRSSQKFNDLLAKVQTEAAASNLSDDFDELDRLIYGSAKKAAAIETPPTGLDQLLSAELSFNAELEAPHTSKKHKNNQKTEIVVVNERSYMTRLTNTPKPDFAQQTNAELLKQLYNYGIKPLKRKQAVKMLEYIYNQTHPILQQQVCEESAQAPSKHKEVTATSSSKSQAEIEINSQKQASASSKHNLKDACAGLRLLRYSNELSAELLQENYILQTNISKKTPQPLLPLHIAWFNLLCANTTLHEDILLHTPIDLQEIYLFLKELGYRYDPKDLKSFFDRRCIIFRYDLTAPTQTSGSNRHLRKSQKIKNAAKNSQKIK